MIDLKNLKAIRKGLNYTQIEVAKKVGVSLTSYQLWERGVSKPNKENMIELEKALKE